MQRRRSWRSAPWRRPRRRRAAPMADPPRNKDGRPDFHGFWNNQSVTTLTRGASVPKLVLTPEEAKEYKSKFTWNVNEASQRGLVDVNKPPPGGQGAQFATTGYNSFWLDHGRHYATVKGEIRSSWLTDPPNGRLPTKPNAGRTPECGRVRDIRWAGDAAAGGALHRQLQPLGRAGDAEQPLQQQLPDRAAPDHVMIDVEMNHDARIVPLAKDEARKHMPARSTWIGDSVGWYEGDTLVVETTNMQSEGGGRRCRRRHGDRTLHALGEGPDPLCVRGQRSGVLHADLEGRDGAQPLERSRSTNTPAMKAITALHGILAGARVQEAAGKTVARNAEVER